MRVFLLAAANAAFVCAQAQVTITSSDVTRALVPNDACVRPGAEDEFLTTDGAAILTAGYTGQSGTDRLRNEWVQPSGAVFASSSQTGLSGCRYSNTLPIAAAPAAALLGVWRARLFFNDREVANIPFRISVPATGSLRVAGASVLPVAVVGAPYSFGFVAEGGAPPYRWSADGLPQGLTLGAGDGRLTGTPGEAGSFRIRVRVQDSAAATATLNVGLPVSAPSLAPTPVRLSFSAEVGTARETRTVAIASNGTSLMFAVTASTARGGNWLSVTSAGPSTPATLTVAANPSGLAAGTYDGTITLRSPAARPAALAVPVQLTVTPSGVSSAQARIIATAVGTEWSFPDGVAAEAAPFGALRLISVGNGRLILPDASNFQILELKDGRVNVVAGNGRQGYSGIGERAQNGSLNTPFSAAEFGGELYFSEGAGIRKVDRNGIMIEVIPRFGGFAGDGGLAATARLNAPRGIAFDAAGNLYIADTGNRRIRRVTPAGVIDTIAGNGQAGDAGDGGPARQASFRAPTAIAVDAAGNVYVSDPDARKVRRIATDGTIRTYAGSGDSGTTGDGGPATVAHLVLPTGLAFDQEGSLYIADEGNSRIRRVTPDGVIRTFATLPEHPFGVAVDREGNVFTNATFDPAVRPVLRRIDRLGNVTIVAGSQGFRVSPEGATATSGFLWRPQGVAFDREGNMIIADSRLRRLRIVGRDGTMRTLTTRQPIGAPVSVAVEAAGSILLTDASSSRVVRVSTDGTATTIASNLTRPGPIALDRQGNIYVSEGSPAAGGQGNRVVRVNGDGTVTPFAGNGGSGSAGDGGPAANATLNLPSGLDFDEQGNLYIGEYVGCRIRRVTPGGTISTVAGTGRCGFSGDGGPAVRAAMSNVGALKIDREGNLIVQDGARLRSITSAGIISTLAGTGQLGFAGDGGPATDAQLNTGGAIGQIAIGPAGDVVFTDTLNDRIRVIFNQRPAVRTAPASFSFTAASGSAVTEPQTLGVAANLPGLAFQVSANTSSGGDWLRVGDPVSVLPATLPIQADPSGLAPGTYRGSVVVTVAGGNPATTSIPVTFNVLTPNASRLAAEPAALSFQIARLRTGKSATVRVTNPGSGSLDFNVSATAFTGGTWLSASVSNAAVTAGTPTDITITANSGTLRAGTYTGRVTLTNPLTNQRIEIPVTLTVTRTEDRPATLVLSRTGSTFLAVRGGGVTPPRLVQVLNIGEGSLEWTAEAEYLEEGPPWLEIAPASGTSAFGAPSRFLIRANPTGLAPGEYYALARVTAPDAANSPLEVQVVLNIFPDGTRAGLAVDPGGLLFVSRAGGQNPGSQTVEITNLDSRPVEFAAGVATLNGGRWLSVRPDRATIPASGTLALTVFADAEPLRADVYTGAVTLLTDEVSRLLPVRVVVAGTNTSTRSTRSRFAEGCTPTRVVPVFTSLLQGFQVPAAWPAPVDMRAVDDCGDPMNEGRVTVSFSSGDQPVPLVAIGEGRWAGTAFPRTARSTDITVAGEAAMDEPAIAGSVRLTGTVRANDGPPLITVGGVVNSASNATLTPVAPGSLVTIYGQRLVEGPDVQAPSRPLPTELSGTQALLAGRRLPMFYAANGQIAAVIPTDLPVNTQFPLVVRRGRTISTPEMVNVASASPGIFTSAQTGSGQGLINVMEPGGGQALADRSRPARAGDRLAIFATGLGETDVAVAAGQPAPADPLARVREEVVVTIGGLAARVESAALLPGEIGVYQVVVEMPAGVPVGDTVPVTVSVGGQTSPAVTVAAR